MPHSHTPSECTIGKLYHMGHHLCPILSKKFWLYLQIFIIRKIVCQNRLEKLFRDKHSSLLQNAPGLSRKLEMWHFQPIKCTMDKLLMIQNPSHVFNSRCGRVCVCVCHQAYRQQQRRLAQSLKLSQNHFQDLSHQPCASHVSTVRCFTEVGYKLTTKY